MPTPKTAEHEPNTMNWRNVVTKMISLGQGLEPADNGLEQLTHGTYISMMYLCLGHVLKAFIVLIPVLRH